MNEGGGNVPAPIAAGPGPVEVRLGFDLLRVARELAAAARRCDWRGRAGIGAAVVLVVVVAGVATGLLVVAAGSGRSAQAVVSEALAETSAGSYSFGLDLTTRIAGREVESSAVSGAVDSGRGRGTEYLARRWRQRSARARIRFIGKYVYTWVSPGSRLGTMARPWNKALIPSAEGSVLGPYGFVSDQPVSPTGLSGILRSAGAVRDTGHVFGAGWAGTRYAFTARFPAWREIVRATIDVDQQGRVRRVVTITSQGEITMNRQLTFFDFGAPVPVTSPGATQVFYSSKPYWGFYF